jgi:hypothetical protein
MSNGTMCRQWLPQDEWMVLLPDTLPGYISWEKYLQIRQRLRDNRSTHDTPGTPRGGSALLGGLAVCGCGRQLRVQYQGRREEDGFYACDRASKLGRTDAWEKKLREQQRLQEDYARFQSQDPALPSKSQRASIARLAHDIPTLWKAAEVTHKERTEIVRCLLERVEVRIQERSEQVDVTLHWCGGFTSQHAVVRPVAHYTQLRDYDRLLESISQWRRRGDTAGQIAQRLNEQGFHSPRSPHFTAEAVRRIWRHCDRQGLLDNEWWTNTFSRRLSVPETRLRDWIRRGWVHARKSAQRYIV